MSDIRVKLDGGGRVVIEWAKPRACAKPSGKWLTADRLAGCFAAPVLVWWLR